MGGPPDGSWRPPGPPATGRAHPGLGHVARKSFVAETHGQARLLRHRERPFSRFRRLCALDAAHVEGQPDHDLVDPVGRHDPCQGLDIRRDAPAACKRRQGTSAQVSLLGDGKSHPARPEVDPQKTDHGAGVAGATDSGGDAPGDGLGRGDGSAVGSAGGTPSIVTVRRASTVVIVVTQSGHSVTSTLP